MHEVLGAEAPDHPGGVCVDKPSDVLDWWKRGAVELAPRCRGHAFPRMPRRAVLLGPADSSESRGASGAGFKDVGVGLSLATTRHARLPTTTRTGRAPMVVVFLNRDRARYEGGRPRRTLPAALAGCMVCCADAL